MLIPAEKNEYLEDMLIYCANDLHMYKLMDITIKTIDNIDNNTLLKLIEDNLKDNNPIAIFTDAFYCPWIKDFYMQHSIPHSFLIININYSDNIVHCVDSFITNDIIQITIEEATKHIEKIGIYCNNEKEKYTLLDVYSIINLEMGNNKTTQKEKILSFAEYVNNDSIVQKDHFSTNSYYNFIFGMKMVLNGRKNIIMLLNYLGDAEQHKRSLNIMENIKESVTKWETAINIIVKGLYTFRRKDFEKAANIIYELSSIEQKIAEQIQVEVQALEESQYDK
jgi:hypothetical protein